MAGQYHTTLPPMQPPITRAHARDGDHAHDSPKSTPTLMLIRSCSHPRLYLRQNEAGMILSAVFRDAHFFMKAAEVSLGRITT
jgi:hypothetical protein